MDDAKKDAIVKAAKKWAEDCYCRPADPTEKKLYDAVRAAERRWMVEPMPAFDGMRRLYLLGEPTSVTCDEDIADRIARLLNEDEAKHEA